MIQLFLSVYRFFKQRKAVFYGLLLLLLAAIGYQALQIRFVEDINSFMPDTKDSKDIGHVFRNIKVKDRIVLLFSSRDTLRSVDPDAMTEICDRFVEALQSSEIGGSHIKSVFSKINADLVDNMHAYTMNHLPVFLDSVDYHRLDSILMAENLDKRMAENYLNLTSPLGMVSRKFILSDPLGIAGNSLQNFNDLQLDLQYDIHNDHIFSADHLHLLAMISPRFGAGEIGKNEALVDCIEEQIAAFEVQYPDISISYFGGIPISVYNARQIKSDSLLTMIIALAIITTVILIAFRRKSAIVLIAIPVLFGAIFSLAVLSLIQGTISIIAIGAGSAVLGVAFSYSIHVFSHSIHTRSAEQVVRELAYPMTIGSFTTIAAFAGLTFSSSLILHDLGLFACFTLVGTTLFCLIFLPHFLSFKPVKTSALMKRIESLNASAFEKNKYLIGAVVFITIVCLFFCNDVKFSGDMNQLSYMPKQFADAEDVLTEKFQDEYKTIYFITIGDKLDDALANYRKTDEKLATLKKQQLIQEYSSAQKLLIPLETQRRRIDLWNNYWTSERKAKVKEQLIEAGHQYAFKDVAFQEFFSLLEKEYAVIDYSSFDRQNILSDWIEITDRSSMLISQVQLQEKEKEAIYQSFNDTDHVVILDKPYFAGKMATAVNDDFNMILYIVSVLVFLSILIAYGRIEIALITFLPMVVSWVIILGLMALFNIEFNIINIIISTFIFGIGDDFSIFITDGLLEEYKNGKKMLSSHKIAIFFSAFTVIVGLGAMIFSKHPALYSISVTSIIGMFSVVLVAYSLQPFIFRLLISGRTAKGKFPHTWYSLLVTIIGMSLFATGSILLMLLSFVLVLVPIKKKHKKAFYHKHIHSFSRFILWAVKRKSLICRNPSGEDFSKPALMIANHQSVSDILQILALHPKIVMVTKSWVTQSPLFGRIVRYADFIDITNGYEQAVESIRERMRDGYSIAIFPEGSRSDDCKIRRFHKGAFFLAEALQADIIPVLLHGQGQTVSKDDPFYVKKAVLACKILERISFEKSFVFGNTYQERSKQIARYFKQEHQSFVKEIDTVNPYFHYKLIKNYIYKGPVLEWYLRVKIRMEKNYQVFEDIIPPDARVTDIGCGYGFLAYMLVFRSEQRVVTGIDYDEEKIAVANHNFSKNERLTFIPADISQTALEPADVFVLNDILHYLPQEEQNRLLLQCAQKLNENGMIILRDGDREKNERHALTRLSEVFSTQILRFNKKEHALRFISTEEVMQFALQNGLKVSMLDNDKYSSNTIYVIRRKS